ncbi:MAG: hypothetical protein A3H01_02175 [Candidatus Wildermuthbacteria bacterium RIFCSPLOWO2_12_FULL_40_9]|uniref:30S ribosomal protein S21 n=2 Tax=Candidatus Wildermuthiibacteriota TaxID=1817923 RepID=A0A1G2RE95_9BACT|nr:MAG: hypothetical protein A3F15_00890 [Candidatus Wildermuthbacteria bacterium RIFCSPHIGHO2_12_FULL_40_12]OHA76211.1 MAG: hypothetical protein A3H01_02175 [Candidatus Wildermuthbacteria bacterium RIFCSPLOWO2_12_FULL_40_9]
MALEVRKKDKETVQSLLYRFNRGVQQSGILVRARKTRFRNRKKSRTVEKKAALRKVEMKKQYQKLKKLGKITPKSRKSR